MMGRVVSEPVRWLPLLIGFGLVFIAFQVVATWLGSVRGEWGLVVCAVVLSGLAIVEMLAFGTPPDALAARLGLGRTQFCALAMAVLLSAVLVAVVPVRAWVTGTQMTVQPGWTWLVPGLFAQAGIAEEALFRGYLFGRLRAAHSFWRAAGLSVLPFAVAHLYLLATMPPTIALASIALSVVIAFPLAHLYEAGGRTIWAPALLHFAVQGTLKLLEVQGDHTLPLIWIAASAIVPWAAFLCPRRSAYRAE